MQWRKKYQPVDSCALQAFSPLIAKKIAYCSSQLFTVSLDADSRHVANSNPTSRLAVSERALL
jgi:dTDP-4-dehydrorhamnose reductase